MRSNSAAPEASQPAILCLAHLGWDFVWQRPQHILSRLAQHYPVLYVNEPEIVRSGSDEPHLRQVGAADGLAAFQPVFPDRPDVLSWWREAYVGLVEGALIERGWAHRGHDGRLTLNRPLILWF